MLSIIIHACSSRVTSSTGAGEIGWMIVWQVVSLLTGFPVHYALYWLYYYPLEYTFKPIFSGCNLIYCFHYLHSCCLSPTVHKTSVWMGRALFSELLRGIGWLSSIPTFSSYTYLCGDFINPRLQSLPVLGCFSGPPLHFQALSYHINVGSFPVECLLYHSLPSCSTL